MKRASAPSYDLFKTIVTGVLAIILLLMLLRGCATTNGSSPAPMETPVIQPIAETLTPTSVPVTIELTATPTTVPSTLTPTSEPTTEATTETSMPATEATPTPAPAEATPTQSQSTSCSTSAPSRLSVGQTAVVIRRLNMRSEPSIDATLIQTNPTQTQVEIIGGPVCESIGDRAYLWWQIRLANGAEGWSAESPLNEATYFLEPIQ